MWSTQSLLATEAERGLFGTWAEFQPQFLSILFTMLIVVVMCLVYNVKIRGHEDGQHMSGFLVMMDMFISKVEDIVVQAMGPRYRKLTPYAMYLILYIFIGSLISLLGIESHTTSYTVTFSMGVVTFVGIYYFGFRYQKWSYFKRYINPIEIFTQFTPLISISFRLYGNIVGGAIILGLLYAMFINLQSMFDGQGGKVGEIFWDSTTLESKKASQENWDAQYLYFWSGFNIFTTGITPWLHMYFDLFDGGIQSLVFTMLTFSYWSEALGEPGDTEEVEVKGRGKISHKRHFHGKQKDQRDLTTRVALNS